MGSDLVRCKGSIRLTVVRQLVIHAANYVLLFVDVEWSEAQVRSSHNEQELRTQ